MSFVVRGVGGVLVLAILSVPSMGFAQQTGTLAGIVRDSQGAVLPGATVTVSSDALIGGARTVITGESGAYQLAGLPPGSYIVAYELRPYELQQPRTRPELNNT